MNMSQQSVRDDNGIARSAYDTFVSSKIRITKAVGFAVNAVPAESFLFPFQSAITRWALRRGKSAAFADTGLGKSRIELSWAAAVQAHTGKPVLILCPLSVAAQTAREGVKIGITATVCREQSDVRPGVNIANYDVLHKFDPFAFGGIALDESSILKSFDGATRKSLQEFASVIDYRIALTATPAPNDHVELGNHAEFLGIMTRTEMLATFFCHDGGETQKWRLKGHAEDKFWQWVATWAVACRKPSDIGLEYSDMGYNLPPMHIIEHPIATVQGDSFSADGDGMLFDPEAVTLTDQRHARRRSLSGRVADVARIVAAEPNEQWLVWCDLNDEGDELVKSIPGAVQVSGKDSNDRKEKVVTDFIEGRCRVLVSKSSIFGFGLNLQNCARMAFVGVTHSYEAMYQSMRRCWRFGQEREVNVHIVYSEQEASIVRNLKRKETDAREMSKEMIRHMQQFGGMHNLVAAATGEKIEYATDHATGAKFDMHLGDCVKVMTGMASGSIDYSIFSPPFASLYTYSNSEFDMGNVRNHSEFYKQFRYAVNELFRVMKSGRLVSIHCMNLPMSKERDGNIGIRDFRGELVRMFQRAGFIFHSEVVIWKDPVIAMQRTKAIGLLYKQLRKDSTISRQGIPDFLVTMRKPGVNPDPVTKTHQSFPVDLWQRYASPVWMDINPSDTLQYRSVREDKDERHICPLQLGVIRRGIELWSKPGDLVFSPFTGIGSEGVVALEMGRRFVGAELKRSYWKQAVANLGVAEHSGPQLDMFGDSDDFAETLTGPESTFATARNEAAEAVTA